MYTKEEQAESIRAVARSLGISEELKHKGHDLLQALELVNISSNGITCLGRCVNGGLCTRHIARDAAVKGLLGILGLVFDTTIVEEELEASLQSRLWHLLCPKNHQTSENAAACMEEKIEAVEEFRSTHGIGASHIIDADSRATSFRQQSLNSTASIPVDWKAAYEALAEKFHALEMANEDLQEDNNILQQEIERWQEETTAVKEDNETLTEQVVKMKAAKEAPNSALMAENQALKAQLRRYGQTVVFLQNQLYGEDADGEEYDGPATSAPKSVGKLPNYIKPESIDHVSRRSSGTGFYTPATTPRITSRASSAASSATMSRMCSPPATRQGSMTSSHTTARRSDMTRPSKSGAMPGRSSRVSAVATAGSSRRAATSFSPSSASGCSNTKVVPAGFKVRQKSIDSQDE